MTPSSDRFYAEIDVTDWPLAGAEVLGTKPKRWLREPAADSESDTRKRWLMKDTTHSRPVGRPTYAKGDDWAERIATGVADRLGLPAARTELASRTIDGQAEFGVISRSVLDEAEKLVHGHELLQGAMSRFQRVEYTIEAIQRAIGDMAPPLGTPSELSAWDVFAGYLLLDALIGNTDRHEENWAVIQRGDESLRLAPTFDHASSLGFMLADEDRQSRLSTRDRGFAPERWAERGRSCFQGRRRLVEVALSARGMMPSEVRDHWLERCQDVDRLVEPIRLVPHGRMSQPARDFAERVLRHNAKRLLEEE